MSNLNQEENKMPTLLNKPVRNSNLSSIPSSSEGIEKGVEDSRSATGSSSQKKESKLVATNSRKSFAPKNTSSLMQKGSSSENLEMSTKTTNKKDGKVVVSQGSASKLGFKKANSTLSALDKKLRLNSSPKQSKKIKVGDVCLLTISALGPKGIGIDEFSYPFSIFVPNTNLRDSVKAKIVRLNVNGNKYAVAKVLKVQKKEVPFSSSKITKGVVQSGQINKLKVEPNQVLTVNIKKLTPNGVGIVNLKYGYKLIIPVATQTPGNASSCLGTQIKVVVTRLKSKYAFAKIVDNESAINKITNKDSLIRRSFRSTTNAGDPNSMLGLLKERTQSSLNVRSAFATQEGYNGKGGSSLLEGSKYTLILPKTNQITKRFRKYVIVKIQGSVVFIRLSLGNLKGGTKVRIKITKVNNKFAIAKIIKINPTTLLKKRILVQNSVRQMIKNGLHLGEKTVKCNARMKNYVWLKKQGRNKNLPLVKKGSHIINLLKTRRCLNKALTQLTKYALKGRTFLFIGTKKPAAGLIARASIFSRTSFFVNTRWLGGLLTNWKTIRKSISKIRPILEEKQKIVADILIKRMRMKKRLINKGLFLQNNTDFILSKGSAVFNLFKNPAYKSEILEKTKKLSLKRKQLLGNCDSLLLKYRVLKIKRRKLIYKNIVLKDYIAPAVISRYKTLVRDLTIYSQKLRQLKYLLILINEIKNIKNKAHQENTKVVDINLKNITRKGGISALKANKGLASVPSYMLPNPPKEFLDFISLIIGSFLTKTDKSSNLNLKNQDLANIQAKATTNNKTLVVSDLINRLNSFAPSIKDLIETYQQNITKIQNLLAQNAHVLDKIKTTLSEDFKLYKKLVQELIAIKTKLIAQRNTLIKVIKPKMQIFAVQKTLIKLLMRLKYLKTPSFSRQIIKTVQILMKKIVDPKLKYPVDNIYDDKLRHYSKKVASARKKKWQRFEKYFGGIAKMTRMTQSQISKTVAIIVGQKEEMNAVRECRKLGIKMFNIVDTNCNPSLADHIIPANDDSRNSIKYVLNKFLVRIRLAHKIRAKIIKNQNKNSDFKRLKKMVTKMRDNLHGYAPSLKRKKILN